MSEKIRYDYEFLQQFCKENMIILTKDYSLEKVNRDTVIEAKCLTDMCDDICSKKFQSCVNHGGFFCKKCTKNNSVIKNKQIFFNKYGVEHPSQSSIIKEKTKQTCLDKYGVEYTLQSKELKEKSKQTFLEKYGVEHNSQTQHYKDKCKKTSLDKYGVENPFQNEEVKEKIKKTFLEKYGVECSLQNKEIKEKIKQTCLEKYGVEYPLQNKEIKEKIKQTCLNKYGVEHQSKSQIVKDKCKKTFLEKYGVECSLQNKEIKEKIKQTCLEKYGTENPQQNSEVSEKASKNAYKSYDYTFPSGRIERIQGYENYMLNDLLQKENISEDDIIVSRSNVPSVWYEDENGKKHRYFVDCYIKSQNRCIEAKSTWTAAKKKDCIYLKQQALKDAGYNCEIWVYDGKGQIVEKH